MGEKKIINLQCKSNFIFILLFIHYCFNLLQFVVCCLGLENRFHLLRIINDVVCYDSTIAWLHWISKQHESTPEKNIKMEVDKTDEQTRMLKDTIKDLQLRMENLEKRMVFFQNLCFLFSFSFIKVLFLLSYKGVLGATSCFALIHSLFVKSLIFDSSIRYVI